MGGIGVSPVQNSRDGCSTRFHLLWLRRTPTSSIGLDILSFFIVSLSSDGYNDLDG